MAQRPAPEPRRTRLNGWTDGFQPSALQDHAANSRPAGVGVCQLAFPRPKGDDEAGSLLAKGLIQEPPQPKVLLGVDPGKPESDPLDHGRQLLRSRYGDMLNYTERPPSIRALKRHFLDRNRRSFRPETLSCAAHLILNLDDSREMLLLGLQHMVAQLGASRADAGVLTPLDPVYAPQEFYYNEAVEAPNCAGVSYSNQATALRATWARKKPVFCTNVRGNPLFKDSMGAFERIGTTSILFQQLALDERPVGITCIDYVREEHEWKSGELEFVHGFCTEFLGPLIGIHQYWNRDSGNALRKPTESELDAIRLAAQGLSCKEIARQLDKSYRTIENQLRNARLMLDARTLPELIMKCEMWL